MLGGRTPAELRSLERKPLFGESATKQKNPSHRVVRVIRTTQEGKTTDDTIIRPALKNDVNWPAFGKCILFRQSFAPKHFGKARVRAQRIKQRIYLDALKRCAVVRDNRFVKPCKSFVLLSECAIDHCEP